MARRKKGFGWRGRLAGAVLLAGLIGAGWLWWQLLHWTPSTADYPEQGAEIGASDGAVKFRTLRALGAEFVYLDASSGANRTDARFASNIDAAQAAGLKVGAVHDFDPCLTADPQSANFVTIVPREPRLLPPVIALDRTADKCPKKVRDAAVESELMTLINQIEAHAGKRAILKVSRRFEDRYHLAGRLDRSLWVVGTRFQPTYAGRPWLLWTANGRLETPAAGEPIRWVVVQP
ncbi:glycoside hydrolase family 25 protein [Tsuneonella mangrovi]|uniref:glycoside hydrolase family 25 protein n=1 Tax=Tsuneonella mangrovi TaxID=1982042 RepID=UPI000BA28BC5|nr:glycoside hydrolase family 25 protein [Tsuneonella mangrovi]